LQDILQNGDKTQHIDLKIYFFHVYSRMTMSIQSEDNNLK